MVARSVFISSTSKDLKAHRDAVNTAINKLEMRAIDMKNFGSRSGGAVDASLDQVAKADFFVGILAHRYGFVPDGMTQAVTEQEYDEAVRLNVPRLMYLVDPEYKWPAELVEADQLAQQRLAAFKTKVEANEVRTLFSSPENLAASVSTDLANAVQEIIAKEHAEKIAKAQAELAEERKRSPSLLKRGWTGLVLLITLLASIVTILFFVLDPNAQNWLRTMGFLSLEKMADGQGLNVLVAGIGMKKDSGMLVENSNSQDISQEVYGQVRQFEGINPWGPSHIGVRSIVSATPAEREQEAADLANTLNADVVIYGYIVPVGDGSTRVDYIPEFYVSAEYAKLGAEYLNAQEFGEPIPVLLGATNNPEVTARINALKLFLDGFADLITGQNQRALDTFVEIITQNPEIEVIYILAGNAAARLNKHQAALDYYTQSLSISTGNPQYSRGLLGRGSGLKKLATLRPVVAADDYDLSLQWPDGTPCTQAVDETTAVELMLDLALICFSEAESSPIQPPAADIDIKVPFERADLFAWRAANGYGDLWTLAQQDLDTVIRIYESADPAKQARIRTQAGQAHGHTAQIILATGGSPTDAVDEFNRAIAILKLDVEVEHAQEIFRSYERSIATLSIAIPTCIPGTFGCSTGNVPDGDE